MMLKQEMTMYRWIDENGAQVSSHSTMESAGRHHRRLCLPGLRCLSKDGEDVTGAAIISSIW